MAFDALDGRALWTWQRPGDALTLAQAGRRSLPSRNTLLVGQGPRLAGAGPAARHAALGSRRWPRRAAPTRSSAWPTWSGPATRIGDLVCARAFQSAVGCVDASRGALLWSRPSAGGAQALGGDAELLLGADASDRVTAWRTPTGDVAWTSEQLLYRDLQRALLAGSVVVVGDFEGQVHFLSRRHGETLLRLPTDGTPVVGTPVLAGTTLLVATRGGGLFAFRPQ